MNNKAKTHPRITPGILSLALAILYIPLASADVLIDFENPPYTTGTVIGQQDWVINNYSDGGMVDSDAQIITTGALAGSQSLQILAPNAGTTVHDISTTIPGTFSEAGAGNDFYLTFLLKMPEYGKAFIGLSNSGLEAFGGGTPDFIVIDGGNIGANNVELLTTDFTPGDLYEFRIGYDLAGQTFAPSLRNITTGGSFTLAPTIPENGSFGTLLSSPLVDPGIIFGARQNSVIIDNIAIIAVPEPGTSVLALGSLGLVLGLRRMRSRCRRA